MKYLALVIAELLEINLKAKTNFLDSLKKSQVRGLFTFWNGQTLKVKVEVMF